MSSSRTISLSLDGASIHVDVVGTGPPVLMIQGVGMPGDGWLPQVEGLADRFTIARFDHRGVGRSRPAGGATVTVPQLASDSLAILDALGWPSAHLVGHSLGGLIALDVALRARSRVRSLSLLCTFADGRRAAPPMPRMIWWGARTRIGTRRMRRRAFLHLILPPGAIVDADAQAAAVARYFGRDLADAPPGVDDQLRAMRAADHAPRLAELVGIPTLVMSATHDLIAPPRLGRAIADGVAGATFEEIADAAHGLPITHATVVNERLAAHFAAN